MFIESDLLQSGLEVSLDELNFCLEWDERAPVWVNIL